MYSEWLRRKVGQVVVVVIDALRADFVLPENKLMNLGLNRGGGRKISSNGERKRLPKIEILHDLIQDDSELVNAFVARANTPTVTMPRIKVSFYMLGSYLG